MNDPSTPNNVVSLVQPPPTETVALASLLRGLADDVERGDIIGVVVVTELTGARVGSVLSVHDVHRALGGLERARMRLLSLE